MRSRLRVLERMMAWDSAEWVLQRVCDRYLNLWDQAAEKGESPPNAIVLWEMIGEYNIEPPGLGLTLEYVTRCEVISHTRPEQKHIMGHLLLRRHHLLIHGSMRAYGS